MTNKCIINSSLVAESIAEYKLYADIWAPIKAIKHPILFQMIDCSNYLVDNDNQIDFLLEENVDIEKCYFGSFKSLYDLDYAIARGVNKFVIASLYELNALIGKTLRVEKLFLTVNALSLLNVCEDRFGLSIEEIESLLVDSLFKEKIEGLAFHLQMPYKTADNYLKVLKKLFPIVDKYRLKINIGGIPSNLLVQIIDLMPNLKQLSIIVEPGNSLFYDAIIVETQVIYVDIAKKIINLNMGIYNGLLDCKILNTPIDIRQHSQTKESLAQFKIYGPTSDNLDYLGEHALSLSTKIGDTVYISNCGIYTLYFNTNFYTKKLVVEIR